MTLIGRQIGTLIIVVGVGIFGTLTGYLANIFLSPARRKTEDQPTDLQKRLEEIKALSAQQQQAIAELEGLLPPK